MACGVTDPVACISEAATAVANAVGTSVLDSMAEKFNEAAEWALVNMSSAWLNLPSPDVSSAASPSLWINEHLKFIVMGTLVLSVLIACGRLVTDQKPDHLKELGKALLRVIVISSAGAIALTWGIEIGDLFSSWIMGQVDFEANQTLALMTLSQPGLIFILAIIVILVQIIQLGIMILRGGMLIFLAGAWPLSAAASNTDIGRQWYLKTFSWMLAFLLYKPVAALLYAGSIMTMHGENDITTQMSGIFMMILAIASLPALLRFMVPATAAMSSGNAGAMAGAVVGAAVATGAIVATGGGAAAAGGAGAASGGGFAASPVGTAVATPTATTNGPPSVSPTGPDTPKVSPQGADSTGGTGNTPGTNSTGPSTPQGDAPSGPPQGSGDAPPPPPQGSGDAPAQPSSEGPTGQPDGASSTTPAPAPAGSSGEAAPPPPGGGAPASSPSGSSGDRASLADIARAASEGAEIAGKGDDTASGMVEDR